MKDKTAAGILALFLGWLGFHRFYLGQTGLGIAYLIFCWFPLVWLIALVDAIVLLSMDQQRFDEKYNQRQPAFGGREADFDRRRWEERPQRREEPRERRREETVPPPPPRAGKTNTHKTTGLEKFKDFDYAGAIDEFKKSLQLDPRDIATHFNLACAYSLTEDAQKAFLHLDKAVQLGFRDFQKLKEHHALAFLRIQTAFENFEQNGFRLQKQATAPAPTENLLGTEPNLLDQLKKLGELREKGLLTEREFEEQKRKLLH